MSVVTRVRTLDPLTLGPALWLDDTGSNAGEWVDKSGNGRNATQGSAGAQPQIVPNVLNGRQVRRFDGGDAFIAGTTSTWNFLHDGTSNEVFIVSKIGIVSDPNTVYCLLDTCGISSPNVGFCLFYDDRASASRNDAVFHAAFRGSAGSSVFQNISLNFLTPSSFCILRASADPLNATAANRSVLSLNGGPESKLNTSTSSPSTSNSLYSLTIGRTGSGSSGLIGDIAEIIIYPYALTSYERQLVEGYLSYKYALPVA